VLQAEQIKKENLKEKNAGDRANNKSESGDISLYGTAAELAVVIKLQKLYPGLCKLWFTKLRMGLPDYGKDVTVPNWLKSFEIKYTASPRRPELSPYSGVLFMRCINGHAAEGEGLHIPKNRAKHGCSGATSYWKQYLPDSFYVLLHQLEPDDNPFLFQFNGWCVRDKFFEFWEENDRWLRVINKTNRDEKGHDGYPAICLHHENLNKDWQDLIITASPIHAITA
jgi:hypothetical protein